MRKDKLSKFLNAQRRLQRQLSPLFETSRTLSESLSGIQVVETNLLRENLFSRFRRFECRVGSPAGQPKIWSGFQTTD